MTKLRLDPAEGSYSAKLGPETLAVMLDGGASRTRRLQLGAAAIVSVEWFMESMAYDYFMAFYRLTTGHGSLPFEVDLILNKAAIAEYIAKFVPDTIELNKKGGVFIVTAQLEILPLAENAVTDAATIAAYLATL